MATSLPTYPNLPFMGMLSGVRTQFGMWTPPGPNIVYVRSIGAQTGDDVSLVQRLVPTLAAGLAQCRAGRGDIVCVLPGHTENVVDGTTMLANLVAGTRIIGMGDLNRDDAPTFTWTTAASSWAITSKNVEISGLRLLMDGFNGVTAPINITASGCRIMNTYQRWSSGASNLATTAITVGSGATDTVIALNYIYGVAAGVCTDGIKLLGATTPDRTSIIANRIFAACTSATGVINVTVAALAVLIEDNVIENMTTSSIAGMNFANVACDGHVRYNDITVKSTGVISSGTTGIAIGAGALVGFHQNYVVNDKAKSGILMPTADT